MGITGSAVDTLGPHSVVRADESLDIAGLRPGQPLVDVRNRLLDERCLRFLRPDRHPAPSPFACVKYEPTTGNWLVRTARRRERIGSVRLFLTSPTYESAVRAACGAARRPRGGP